MVTKAEGKNNITFRVPNDDTWHEHALLGMTAKSEDKDNTAEKTRILKDVLLSSLQMSNVIVLAGSGTSIGEGGPSMQSLWDTIFPNENSNSDEASQAKSKKTLTTIGYDISKKENKNIEYLLSHCEAYLQVHPSESTVAEFINDAKKIILRECTKFLDSNLDIDLMLGLDTLKAHKSFLHRLSRRRARDPRLKVFTTNYDLCFEVAAASQGLIPIDGFSFTKPRKFDPRFFGMDIVRRPRTTSDHSDYVEGIFHLLKLHGSVNWSKNEDGSVEENGNASPQNACLVYPAKGKYQQSFIQPHLELISQFFSALREPQTCLITIGYGFNDDHLSEPILSAVKTNPHFRLIVVDANAQQNTTDEKKKYWDSWAKISSSGGDVLLINATFDQFSQIIPDLKSLSPAQKLETAIKGLT